MKTRIKFFFPVLLGLFFAACDDNKQPAEEIDTPTSGKVKISIDENIRPVADELIDAFESSYENAFLFQRYGNEDQVVKELYNDSTRLAIMTRPLRKDEVDYFQSKTFGVEQIRIGMDAVALLVNRNNADSILTVETVKRILLGEDSLWSQVRAASALGPIRVVFDNSTSSNLRYLSDTLLGGKAPGKTCFAVHSNDSVVKYVNEHAGAIGIIGLNWLSDRDSKEDMARRSQVALALIGKDSASAIHPHQSALVTKTYPFCRSIWIVKIGKRAGLGTGFASFSLGDRGQLIVQRAGLAPASPAERRIQLKVY